MNPSGRSSKQPGEARARLWAVTEVVRATTPTPGYAITVRVETPSSPGATAALAATVMAAGGVLTGLDIVESRHNHLVVDITCDTSDTAHAQSVADMINAMDGVHVRKV